MMTVALKLNWSVTWQKNRRDAFGFDTSEGDRQIFSIIEGNDEGLTIILKRSLRMETFDGIDEGGIKETRISVHPSERTLGNTIAYTARLDTGLERKIHAFVIPQNAEKVGLLWPIYSARMPLLSEKSYYKSKKGFKWNNLGNFDQGKWSMIFMLVVRDRRRVLYPIDYRWNFETISYKRFFVDIIWTFVYLPSIPISDFMLYATSQPLENGVPLAGPTVVAPKSMSDADFLEIQKATLTIFISGYKDKFIRLMAERGQRFTDASGIEFRESPTLVSGSQTFLGESDR